MQILQQLEIILLLVFDISFPVNYTFKTAVIK